MTGRPRTVSDTAIFDAVTEVIRRDGPLKLTLGAVAELVGVSAPALAQRFGSKRALLVAYASAQSGGVDELFAWARAARDDPLDALRAALVGFGSSVGSREELANSLAFLHLDLTDPELGRHAIAQSRAIRRHLEALVDEALARGSIEGVAAAELTDTLYTAYNGSLITWALDGDASLSQWIGARIDRVLFPYLCDDQAPAPDS